jgi:hypothetical protein
MVSEGAVVKLLRTAGVTPTAISAVKKALVGQGKGAVVGGSALRVAQIWLLRVCRHGWWHHCWGALCACGVLMVG